jgi:hypothetical protein
MNIFYLDQEPKQAAQWHFDKHVVKMIVEYAQLMSTAHRQLDGEQYIEHRAGRRIKRWRSPTEELDSTLYKATHNNHPSAIWTRASKANYEWLFRLFVELLDEYTHRYGKVHSTSRLIPQLTNPPSNISDNAFTEPPPAMPDECKIPGDSIASYKNYYIQEKQRLANWKHRDTPYWWQTLVTTSEI